MSLTSRKPLAPARLRKLIADAMELERQTMQLYCKFECRFAEQAALRAFWFDMAQHESRHFGALALVTGLLDGASDRALVVSLTPARVQHLRALLKRLHREVDRGVDLERAFEMALEIEGSEIEDVVLELLEALKGEAERERAARLLIHDLGDLGYMIERFTKNSKLLARADDLLEAQVTRLRQMRAARGATVRRRRGERPSTTSPARRAHRVPPARSPGWRTGRG